MWLYILRQATTKDQNQLTLMEWHVYKNKQAFSIVYYCRFGMLEIEQF